MSPRSLMPHLITYLTTGLILLSAIGYSSDTHAEYGDIVLNNFSDESGIRPIIFPHWFHRIRYSCKTCHSDLGFQMKAGASQINMLKIINGEYCGACHNGQVAWSIEYCELCHSAKKNTPTQVHKGTENKLKQPGKL